jgi:two-component system LytT family response regulator
MLRLLVVDDEKAVRGVIKDIISIYVPDVQVIAEADGVSSGLEAIRKYSPDLVLLDIKMADGTGFDLLKKLDNTPFKVIFITAYEEYAIRAFKYSAIDYILKPIDPEELVRAIKKAGAILEKEMVQRLNVLRENLDKENPQKKILVKTADNIFLVRLEDLFCCESHQSYTQLHLANKKTIWVSRPLKEYEDMLQSDGFFRIHKSFLINLNKIDHYEKAEGGFVIMQNGMKAPVASRKRDEFLNMFEKLA